MASANEALQYLALLARHLNKNDVWSVVSMVLIDLGFSMNHDGTKYLRKAILFLMQYPERTLMKVIYSDVGRSYAPRVKVKAVEHAMRYAMDEAWKCSEGKRWRTLFPVDADGEVVRPTNSEFIARIACLVEIWQACEEGEFDEREDD